jgi:uncharacterized membrane protein
MWFWMNVIIVLLNAPLIDRSWWGAWHGAIAICAIICMYGLMATEPRK